MRPIDADALKSTLENQPSDFYDFDELIPLINEQPTLSPDDVRPVGKWVKNHDEVMWWWECSKCKEKPLIARFGDAEVLSAYCPRCGARMKGAEDGTTE